MREGLPDADQQPAPGGNGGTAPPLVGSMSIEVRQAPEQERALIQSMMVPYIAELSQFEERQGGV